jgi:hypothetical protein
MRIKIRLKNKYNKMVRDEIEKNNNQEKYKYKKKKSNQKQKDQARYKNQMK